MEIGIIGAGFVGGTTAKVLEKSHNVSIYDKYKPPYNTEGHLENIAKKSECAFICVPTPMKKSGEIDYTNIYNSIDCLLDKTHKAGRRARDLLVVIRSTAVSGTTDQLAEKYPFRFAFNPEFLREKHALEDMQNTDRVVVGANDAESAKQLEEVYKPVFPNAKYLHVDRRTAEMIKYAANCFLASQVAIANEIFGICEAVGVDYETVKTSILHDNRIGRNIDVPGHDGDFGFGGKCFPKDLNALIYIAREHMHRPYLLEEVWRLNERVRKDKDWLKIEGATEQNNFGKK